MLELASYGYITATDLADFLVTNYYISFSKDYQKNSMMKISPQMVIKKIESSLKLKSPQ